MLSSTHAIVISLMDLQKLWLTQRSSQQDQPTFSQAALTEQWLVRNEQTNQPQEDIKGGWE